MDINKLTAFIEQIARLKKWEPEAQEAEMDPPSEGAWDSHDCLMGLIDEARALHQSFGHLAGHLARVVDMARTHLEDIETGLQDGTYDPADNADVGEKRQALEGMEAYLAGISQTKRHLVVVEGDVEPFVIGPFEDEASVLRAARAQRDNDPEGQNGIFWLEITDGVPHIGAYPGDLLMHRLFSFVVAFQCNDPERAPRFRNHYHCTSCGQEWNDVWDSRCDDDCPVCGTVMTPHASEDLDVAVEFFPCEAEDAKHALEQAANADPGATLLGVVASWMHALQPGDEVFWNDPNGDEFSGFYTVEDIHTGTGRIETPESVLKLRCDGPPGLITVVARQIEEVTS